MINARQAREQTQKDYNDFLKIELRKIELNIRASCSFGLRECSFKVPERYYRDVRDVLVESGYRVVNQGASFTISW